jgi:[acyl-carrier-protein] S-malonyltransferase
MLAVVFPGQGSQSVGMAADFAERSTRSREAFEEADRALGEPIGRWIREGPEELLRRTEVTQPALLVASIAIWRELEPLLSRPAALFAGHSLGEYTALVAAGALELGDAVRLVRLRGAAMAEATPEGAGGMLAVLGLDGEAVAGVCEGIGEGVAAANFNSPVQTVIAGTREALDRAAERLKEAGAKRLVPLDVSAPFHCALMRPAMEKLQPALAEVPMRDPRVPVVSNVTGRAYTTAAEARRLLCEQVCAAVRWVECVKTMVAAGARVQLEVGPGNVLSGLAGRIERSLACARVSTLGDLDAALARVSEALA